MGRRRCGSNFPLRRGTSTLAPAFFGNGENWAASVEVSIEPAAGLIGETLNLISGALHWRQAAFDAAASGGVSRQAAFIVAVLAGISELAGQSFILVANRVPIYRILLALLLTGLIYPLMAFAWTFGAFLFARRFEPENSIADPANIEMIAAVVALAFAPRIFGIVSIAPYFGVAFGRMLDLWVMALVIFGLGAAANVPLWGAAASGVVGWAAQYFVRRFLGGLLARPLRAIRKLVLGSPLDQSPKAIIDGVLKRTLQKQNAA